MYSMRYVMIIMMMLHPTFPADEFNGLRQRRIVDSRMRLSRPQTIARDTAQGILFNGHPAGAPAPPPESLAALTPESLASWHRERYTPAKTVVSCIGRVRPSAFVAQIEKLLGGWKAAEANVTLPPNPPPATARRILLIDRPGAAQTELVAGGLLFDRRDPDFFPFTVTNIVLVGSPNSRLYRILRNEKGYAFNVIGTYATPRFPGFWEIRAG